MGWHYRVATGTHRACTQHVGWTQPPRGQRALYCKAEHHAPPLLHSHCTSSFLQLPTPQDPSPHPSPPLAAVQRPGSPSDTELCAQHLRGCPRLLPRLLPTSKEGEGSGLQAPLLHPDGALSSRHPKGQLGGTTSWYCHTAESHQLPARHRHRGLLPTQVQLHHLQGGGQQEGLQPHLSPPGGHGRAEQPRSPPRCHVAPCSPAPPTRRGWRRWAAPGGSAPGPGSGRWCRTARTQRGRVGLPARSSGTSDPPWCSSPLGAPAGRAVPSGVSTVPSDSPWPPRSCALPSPDACLQATWLAACLQGWPPACPAGRWRWPGRWPEQERSRPGWPPRRHAAAPSSHPEAPR